MCKRIIAVITSILLAVTAPFTAFCSEINTLGGVKNSVEGVILYKTNSLNCNSTSELLDKLSENAGDFSNDWYYIALSQYGINCKNDKSIKALKNAVNAFYEKGLENVKVTDMQRVAFALLACKEDITDVDGHNLLADSTYNRSKYKELDSQGVNSLAYALLLLDSKDYATPKNAELNRDKIIDKILSYELENGGYALFGNGADIDITSIVLQALAPYKSKAKVKSSINNCLKILTKRQDSSGAFKSFSGKITAESTAQVIIALTSLGINPTSDSRFIQNGHTSLDGLYCFITEGGGFCHMIDLSVNNIATYQSLCALVASYRFLNGNGAFYDFKAKVKSNTKTVDKKINKSNSKKKIKKKKASKIKKTNSPKSTSAKKYNSIIENKAKETKPKLKNNKKSETVSRIIQPTQSLNNNTKPVINKKKTKKTENPSAKETQYFNAVILLAGYILIFSLKSGGKK